MEEVRRQAAAEGRNKVQVSADASYARQLEQRGLQELQEIEATSDLTFTHLCHQVEVESF